MTFETVKFSEITVNHDKKRIPLSTMERSKRQGSYRYYGAQGVIDYIDDYIFDGKYLLIAEDGENLKAKKQNIAQLAEGRFWVNNHAHIVQCNERCRLEYLCFMLNSMDLSGYITGSAQPKLSQANMNNISFEIPSVEMQDLILSVILPIEKRIATNTAINENLEQQIQTILLNLIKSDSQKDSIENVKLGDYLYIKGRIGWKGLKKDEYLESSDYRIINGESLTKDGIDWRKAGYISAERYDESPEIMLQTGDILLSKDGTIGKIGYVDRLDSPSTVASGIFVIRNIKPDIISTPFIYYLLKSKLFTAFIASRTEGSVIPHLYQKDFMEFMIPLPNAQEMNQFDSLTSPLFATIVKNLRENELLAATRDALLPKLMNGEIDVSAVQI